MFHIVLVFTIAIGVGFGAGSRVSTGEITVTSTTPEALVDTAPTAAWQPEPQDPTGKFTTATEVKPILTATKTAWVAVREYDGKDLLYFTHLVAWRCGLHEIQYSVNDAAPQVFEVEDCYTDTAQPNAMKMETHLPYVSYDLRAVNSVTVTVIYDDASTDSAAFGRKDILMP